MSDSVPVFLIIQTAFLGDVILSLPLAQELKEKHPHCIVHLVVRKGNESILQNHPAIDEVFIWNKKGGKYKNLRNLIFQLRKVKYTQVFNLQRFFTTGLLTTLVKTNKRSGFNKNPFSFLFSQKINHKIPHLDKAGETLHEIQRNLLFLYPDKPPLVRPELYPSDADYEKIRQLAGDKPYFVIAPASVWFTKQWPKEKWEELLGRLPLSHNVFLVGAPSESAFADSLSLAHPNTNNLMGKLSPLQSAALMKEATHVFTNDSAPLHMASAVNARVTAIFCSTVPAFGFGPVSAFGRVAETMEDLVCRPCGLHGKSACPQKHFKCAKTITATQVFNGEDYYNAIAPQSTLEERLGIARYFLRSGKLVLVKTAGRFLLLAKADRVNLFTPHESAFESVEVWIKNIRELQKYVSKIPHKVYEEIDKRQAQNVKLQFHSVINLPDELCEPPIFPFLIHDHKVARYFLEDGKPILCGRLKADIAIKELLPFIHFYLPLETAISSNNLLSFDVDNGDNVRVAEN